MVNVLLICCAGMSTSMLVKKMETAATEIGVEAKIWAVGDAESDANLEKADIVLLGPQVRYLQSKIKGKVNDSKPVDVIDTVAYGTMNGKKVLETALKSLEASK